MPWEPLHTEELQWGREHAWSLMMDTKNTAALMARWSRAWDIIPKVARLTPTLYNIPSCTQPGTTYGVLIDNSTARCTCPDGAPDGHAPFGWCKHALAAWTYNHQNPQPKQEATMLITTIKASIRLSRQINGGDTWATVELGAEATVDSLTEDPAQAHASLYAHLRKQLATLWPKGTNPAAPAAPPAATADEQPAPDAQPPMPQPEPAPKAQAPQPQTSPVEAGDVCPEHGQAEPSQFKGLYCPYRYADGTFCKWTSGRRGKAKSKRAA